MKTLQLNEMEDSQGGLRKIPSGICAAAFTISMFGLVGLAIGGPTSLGCLLAGESIL